MWLRAAFFITGIGLLFWLSVEDLTLQIPLFLAAWVAVLAGLRLWVRDQKSPCNNAWHRYPLAGGLLGALIPLLAVLATLFKSGLHAHGFLEFTASELGNLLRLTPTLALAGLAMGLGASLWCWRRFGIKK